MKIILVEDNHFFVQRIREDLFKKIKNLNLVQIQTELEFRKNIENIISPTPDLIIVDVMLRWTNPSPSMELPPNEILEEGLFSAGIRCKEILLQHKINEEVPILIISALDDVVLDQEKLTMEKNVFFHEKNLNSKSLINRIISLLKKENHQGLG